MTNYKLSGYGEKTVLFLHGWGANLNSFSFFAQNLGYGYKTLAIDFLGHGKTKSADNVCTVFDYALQVYELLKKLNIDEIVIIAHSFGVRVAIMLNTMFDIKIDKNIFIGGAGFRPRQNIVTKAKILNYKLLKFLNNKLKTKFNLTKFGSADYLVLNNLQKQTFKNIVNYNQKKYLSHINNNTLIICGSNDKSTPVYMAKQFNKHIKKSSLKIINNADHFCHLTHKTVVFQLIKNFL